jgi:hypothetical protein
MTIVRWYVADDAAETVAGPVGALVIGVEHVLAAPVVCAQAGAVVRTEANASDTTTGLATLAIIANGPCRKPAVMSMLMPPSSTHYESSLPR